MKDAETRAQDAAPRADDSEVSAWIDEMRCHVAAAPEIYRPGAFWGELIERNTEMLRSDGIRNLKRTVSNNYYNWLVVSWWDPQLRRAALHWSRRPRLAPLRARMEPVSALRTTTQDEPVDLSSKAARRYRLFVAATWEYARHEDQLGLTERLEEPEAGNPVRLWSRRRLISQDLANSILECNYAARSGHVQDGARIAELGAGYGRLAHVFSSARHLVYCIFDIPPALAVSQWYLRAVLGRDRIVPFRPDVDDQSIAALEPGTVAFFTPDQLERFPDGWFHLTQTISTIPEMPERQAEHVLRLLAAKSSGEMFLKQWRRWRNEADDIEFSEDRYVLPPPWRLVARRVDPVQPLFFNQRWRREQVAHGAGRRARAPLRP
jgi:putative sugar O-methyltransferase